MNDFVVYLRVSTTKQGEHGLGIDAQRKMCSDFIERERGVCLKEFIDVESGTHRDRKGLWLAIDYCKKNNCSLVIAKLDRLARDVEFTFRVINTGIDIHFTDMPVVNSMILGVFAAVAQYEREMVSSRTKQALVAKKARGEALGGQCEKWIEAYNNKTKEQKKIENMKKGKTKNERYFQNRDTQAFFKVLKNVFPELCQDDDVTKWDWNKINTKGEARDKIINLMKDYKELDDTGVLFHKWDFTMPKDKVVILMRAYLSNIKKTVKTYTRFKQCSL